MGWFWFGLRFLPFFVCVSVVVFLNKNEFWREAVSVFYTRNAFELS